MNPRIAALFVVVFQIGAAVSQAGQAALAAASGTAAGLPSGFLGPPPPALPDTVARDERGHVTIRAVRLAAPLRVDGQLDEAVYRETSPASGFLQTEPHVGEPATEKTELWVMFDAQNVYVGARLWESHPERMVVNEMRKDSASVFQNETFSFVLDTFYDRRNAVGFIINPIGGRQDGQITNERWNRDWNAVWDFGLGRFDGGWTVEFAIPFKSLRYRPGGAQIWGFNARRVNKWKNEISHLTATPAGSSGNGLFRISLAATLVGIEAPPGSRNLEVKPYAISDVTTDRLATPRISNDLNGEVGVDLKYGMTQNLTADFTYNTDFAQVEADEQQVNLTRFSLFFPEKREFFLENPGLFTFGGIGTGNQGTPSGDAPLLFYSRRIGLNGGRIVPIDAGARLTGRVGRYTVGLANIQTGSEAVSRSRATNFSVVRLRRDVLRKSSVGVLATGRSVGVSGAGSNVAFGVDGVFSFFDNLDLTTYWARTSTEGRDGDSDSYRASLEYAGDRYGLEVERLVIGDNFNPEVGFLRRHDIRRTSGLLRFSPRPRASRLVRKYVVDTMIAYIENGAGRLETRESETEAGLDFHNGDRASLSYIGSYEFLASPFRIAPGVTLPIGRYSTGRWRASYSLGTQRVVSSNMSLEHGSFYSGHRDTLSFSGSRVKLTSRLAVEPSFSVNRVDLTQGAFTARLAGSRITFTMTPLMFASALVQYNSTSHALATNARLRWEYRPGSELFVVYNEERDTLAPSFPGLSNRSFIIKINRLVRF